MKGEVMDALADALRKVAPIEPPDEHTRFAPEAEASIYEQTADRILARLAEQGYVLVNGAELREKIEAMHDDPIRFGHPRDAYRNACRAVLALLDDAHPA